MENNIGFRSTLAIGFMLFALFFGAGNLVFPAMLGQSAGERLWEANLGFLATGVGLPILGTLALGYSGAKDLLALASRAHPWFGLCYTTALYLSIGPLFALPRTGSVSYEIGLKPFVGAPYESTALALFTILFFGVTLLFSLRPAKVVELVGNLLTPALLGLIALLAAAAVAFPLGPPQEAAGEYASHPFFSGFQEGYLTMDTLAAFVFGIIVIEAVRARGAVDRKRILLVCLRAATISAILLAVIYSALAYIGAGSVYAFGPLGNGGEVLLRTANHYFGAFGGAVLGIIVLLACLTTSIGLTIACGTYFHRLVPAMPYPWVCIALCAVSAVTANAGLAQIISFSIPVLTILYPLAIAIIGLTFLHDRFRGKRSVYAGCFLATFLVSLVSGLADTPLRLGRADDWLGESLPLYDIGLGWVIPACVGALLGLLWPNAGHAGRATAPEEGR